MDRYDTDLWKFLQGNNEKSFGISDRLELANKFTEKVEEIKSKRVHHSDLKPQNVLLNLKQDGQWNGQVKITDFGIAKIGDEDDIKAGTRGWAEGSQFADGDINSDNFAARLVVFMILLPLNTVWVRYNPKLSN